MIRKEYTDFGGAERYIAQLAHALSSAGHEVHIYAQKWNDSRKIMFHKVSKPRGPKFVQILSFAYSLRTILEKENYDIIHGFERTFYQDIYRAGDGCHREWLRKRKFADNFFKRRTYYFNPMHESILHIEKKLYGNPRLKLVIANSNRGKEEIIRHYNFPPERIRVIYNGLNESFVNPGNLRLPCDMNVEKGEKILLFVGSGFERKNLATAIKALSLINDPEVRLWVLGRDRIWPYRNLARKMGVENRIVFAGPRSDPRPYYLSATAFLLPSLYEPFSNACLEASALGLPVATSRVNGFSELIKPGENGHIIENPLDKEEVAEKARACLAISRIDPVKHPTIRDNVQSMLGLYKTVRNEGYSRF